MDNFLSRTRAFTKQVKDWKGKKRPLDYSRDPQIRKWQEEIEELSKSGNFEAVLDRKYWINYRNSEIEADKLRDDFKKLYAKSKMKGSKSVCFICKKKYNQKKVHECFM